MFDFLPMKNKRLDVGGLSLPHDTRGSAGSIVDKVGSVSTIISQGNRISNSTTYTTTSTSWVSVGTPLEFYLDRGQNLLIFVRADLRNNNANDDGSWTDFRLYDSYTSTVRSQIASFGEFAYDSATPTTWLNAAQKFDLDILNFSAGWHNLTPQIAVNGTGTARLFRMDYGYQALGN